MSALAPLHVKRDVSDLSDFTSFVVPTRTLTAPERAVYRELGTEWAVLDAKAQAALYAMLLDGRLADFISSVFTKTASSIYTREERIEHQKTRDLVHTFHKSVLEEHGSHQIGFYRTAGEQFARVIVRDMIPRRKTSWWQRVLTGEYE